MTHAVAVSADQVLWYRARKTGFGVQVSDASRALAGNLGIQSQSMGPSLFGLSQRVVGGTTAADLRARIEGENRDLVRIWGPRGTIHIYPVSWWARIIAARKLWTRGGRNHYMPSDADLEIARQRVVALGGPVTRSDLLGDVQDAYIDEIQPHVQRWAKQMVKGEPTEQNIRETARRFAAGRLIWTLCNNGELCIGAKLGTEQSYSPRALWIKALDWPELDPEQVCIELIRAFIRSCAPVTERDVAHFFGTKITMTRRWIAALQQELVPVSCEGRDDLMMLQENTAEMTETPPDDHDWRITLLPVWDGYLMMHHDKSWTTPVVADQKQIWRSAAVVKAPVLRRGRVIAWWEQKARKRWVGVTIRPLSGWRSSDVDEVGREANKLAVHLGLASAKVEVAA